MRIKLGTDVQLVWHVFILNMVAHFVQELVFSVLFVCVLNTICFESANLFCKTFLGRNVGTKEAAYSKQTLSYRWSTLRCGSTNQPIAHSLAHSLAHSPLTRSLSHSLAHSPLTSPLSHSLAHSLAPLTTHSPHSPLTTHSVRRKPSRCRFSSCTQRTD